MPISCGAATATRPIVYQVDRSRDGKSFSNRRVVAIQHGEQIFNMTASFQVEEAGFEHRSRCREVPPPEELPDAIAPLRALPRRCSSGCRSGCGASCRRRGRSNFARCRRSTICSRGGARRRARCGSARSRGLPDERCCTVACSPTCRISFCSKPRRCRTALDFLSAKLVMASIDHAMWFHRPLRVDDWLLYAVDSPSASGARGFARASVFARDGRLVASTAQEGLVRLEKASLGVDVQGSAAQRCDRSCAAGCGLKRCGRLAASRKWPVPGSDDRCGTSAATLRMRASSVGMCRSELMAMMGTCTAAAERRNRSRYSASSDGNGDLRRIRATCRRRPCARRCGSAPWRTASAATKSCMCADEVAAETARRSSSICDASTGRQADRSCRESTAMMPMTRGADARARPRAPRAAHRVTRRG